MKELIASLISMAALLYALVFMFHLYGVVEDVFLVWTVVTSIISVLILLLAFDGLRTDEEMHKYV